MLRVATTTLSCLLLLMASIAQGFQPNFQRRNAPTRLYSQPNEDLIATKNPVDIVLSALISDTGSVVLGSTGLIALLIGRLVMEDTVTSEQLTTLTRETLLAVLSIGAVLLNGLSQLDVPSALAETVELDGIGAKETLFFFDTNTTNQKKVATTISWMLESLVKATPAATAVLLERSSAEPWKVVAAVGILPPAVISSNKVRLPNDTPILDRFQSSVTGESYLPTLQALPGKSEFTYLPVNTQAVLLASPRPNSVLVLGSNQARSFTPRDIAWCQSVVSRA